MGFQYDDLPHWVFNVAEQSAGVYSLNAIRDGGITGGGTGTDPDALLDESSSGLTRSRTIWAAIEGCIARSRIVFGGLRRRA
jgi:hypothetical protein